jgi:hypothetical protein
MTTSLESYATLLDMLVRTFLLDPQSRRGVGKTRLQRAVEAHQKSFTSLKTNLDEARSEWALNPPDPPLKGRRVAQRKQTSILYGEAVDSLTRLGQHLAGSARRNQIADRVKCSPSCRKDHVAKEEGASKDISQENPEGSSQAGSPPAKDKEKERVIVSVEDEEDAMLAAAAQMFGDLVDDVGPPMTALTVRSSMSLLQTYFNPIPLIVQTACISTLKRMRGVFLHLRNRQSSTRENDLHDFMNWHLISRGLSSRSNTRVTMLL